MRILRVGKRATANILAALRFWQEELVQDCGAYAARSRFPDHFHDVEPYDSDEIDQLCEAINAAEDKLTAFVEMIARLKLTREIENPNLENDEAMNRLITEARQLLTEVNST